MPVSDRPRRHRGTPQYVRDLQGDTMQPHERRLADQIDALHSSRRQPNPLQRQGARLADAVRATTREGDAILGRMGVRTKTGALVLGGGAVAATRRRKVEKASGSQLKSMLTADNIERAGRMVSAAAGEAKKPAARAARPRKAPGAASSAPEAVAEATRRGLSPTQRRKLKLAGGSVTGLGVAGLTLGASGTAGHRLAKAHTMDGTNVRSVTTPRGQSGKFVSHENDLQVYHPQGRSSGRRTIDSGLARYGSKKRLVGKADYTPTAPPAPNSRGHRLG